MVCETYEDFLALSPPEQAQISEVKREILRLRSAQIKSAYELIKISKIKKLKEKSKKIIDAIISYDKNDPRLDLAFNRRDEIEEEIRILIGGKDYDH